MNEAAKEARKAYNKAYYEKNKERIRAYHKKWRDDNPGKYKEYNEAMWTRKAEQLTETE